MLRATGFGSPIRRRSSRWSRPKQPKTSFRTSPIRLAAYLAVVGLVLANMIVAYRLLGEEDSSVAVVLGKGQQHGEGSAFERLREALDNLSRDEIGAPILINGGTSEAPPTYVAQELSTPLTVSKSVVAGSDSSSNSSGSGSSGSGSDDEGDDNEGSDESSDEGDEGEESEGEEGEGEEGEGDEDEGSDEGSEESSDEGDEGEGEEDKGDDKEGSDESSEESSDEGDEGEGEEDKGDDKEGSDESSDEEDRTLRAVLVGMLREAGR